MTLHEKGPIEILCDEIGQPFDKRLERPEMLLAFVGELVAEVEFMMGIADRIKNITGHVNSEPAAAALAVAGLMVTAKTVDMAKAAASQVHDISHAAGEEVADRPLEMLSACASAIRFGMEVPCRSRHAAEAARMVWQRRYGVTLSDRLSPAWAKDWARTVFQRAVARMAVAGLEQTDRLRAALKPFADIGDEIFPDAPDTETADDVGMGDEVKVGMLRAAAAAMRGA